jgi:hypothetical protein
MRRRRLTRRRRAGGGERSNQHPTRVRLDHRLDQPSSDDLIDLLLLLCVCVCVWCSLVCGVVVCSDVCVCVWQGKNQGGAAGEEGRSSHHQRKKPSSLARLI